MPPTPTDDLERARSLLRAALNRLDAGALRDAGDMTEQAVIEIRTASIMRTLAARPGGVSE